MSETKMIPFSEIRLDGGTQCRECIDQDVVKQYKSEMLGNDEFPPLQTVFDGVVHWLWDGFHRYHAIRSIGVTKVEVECRSGTQQDAQDLALSANGKHGLSRTNADKRKAVEAALAMPRHADKSDHAIAQLCDVSKPFVGSIRNPHVKQKQAKNLAKHAEKQDKANDELVINYGFEAGEADTPPRLTQDYGPSDEELKANELSKEADVLSMNKLLEADDALATSHAEVTRLNYLVAQLQVRIAALMRERNFAIGMVKEFQAKEKSLGKRY